MSKGSDAVKRWRHNTKKRMIDSMGGKCQICGYDKCQTAMKFHHLNPEEKELKLGSARGNPSAWKMIAEELKKCILLCGNCHDEVHEGIIKIPKKFETFNMEYEDYLAKQKEDLFDICPICKGKKHINQKTCSYKCAARLQYSFDWDNIDLEGMYKKGMSINKISEEVGCSFPTVKKRLIKMKLI